MRLPRVRPESSQRWAWALALVLGLLACTAAWALDPAKPFDQYVANRWSIQDGLPQISVLSITQDRDGYIWVGTQNGLARFDGVRFTSYTRDNEPKLQGIWIRALMLDRSDRLWIGSYKGLSMYSEGRFTAIPPADKSAHPTLDVYAIAQDEDGTILAATTDGVMHVEKGKLVATAGSPVKPALSLLLRHDGLWVGSSGTVYRVESHRTVSLPLPANAAGAAVNHLVEAQGKIWAGTSQGLYFLDGDTWTAFADPVLSTSPVGALFEDHDQNLWVGANPSLARIRDGRLIESYVGSPPMTYKNVTSAFEDREGNLWFGSQVEGLTRLWNGWTRRYSVDDGLNDPVVWSLSKDPDGTIWVGTSDGVSTLEFGHFHLIAPGSALPHPHAYNLLAERDQLWIGTRRGLVIRHQDGSIESPALFAPMSDAQINGIVREPDGALWFPTSDGLFRLEHEGQADAHLRHYGRAEGLPDPRVRAILYLHDGRMLVGTETGLYELRDERLTPVGRNTGLPDDIDVTAIHELPSGAIAVGTDSEQLYVSDGSRWNRFGPNQGMPANGTFFMTEDDRGFLWLTGFRGIIRVPLEDFARYSRGEIDKVRGEMILNERGDRNAGQQGFCCNGAGMSKGYIDGHVLWLPSRDGVVALDTHGIVKNPVVPNVVIEGVSSPDGSYTASTMPAMLDANQRDLSFEFTAPSFQDPHSIQIRYRLLGYDKDWHELDDPGRRRANYTNLPPGDYTFEAMAANNAGLWNPVPARLSFGIRPRFHETRLFDGLIALLIATIVYAGYRFQRQQHEIQRAALERKVEERTQQLHVSNARLENASQTDPTTGLRNRRYLANQIPADLAFYDREQQRDGKLDQTMLFALVRIDRADPLHADHNVPVGDRVLQQFAQVLTALVRCGDYVVHWDESEILLMFRPMHSRYIDAIGERIRDAMRGHAFDGGTGAPLPLSCAIGIAEYPLYRDALRRPGWEQMIGLAHAAMLWVARQGRDGWAAFRPSLRSDLANVLRELGDDPQPLIDNGRLQVLSSHLNAHSDANPDER
ncbi:MAG TPA: two-component regulator propeller domain-containing protein [Xanthomonadaceae bacterium]|jgi:diguanylate cyclase (GGDEF)-like protein|nr:two-component regulator propeller domain-containing protein [Xanthomonadaceae bacterium]